MRKPSLLQPALMFFLAACSSSGAGGIQPEPTATGAGGARSGSTGVGGGSAATGTGGASALNEQTAQWVMDRLPGRWSNAAQLEEMPTLRAKDLSVCALEAPELGDRVLYVERSDPSAPDQPDVQIILDIEAISLAYNEAVAKMYVPEQPEVWVGLCDGAATLPAPPTELRGLGIDCDGSIFYNDGPGKVTVTITGGPACLPSAPEGAVQGTTSIYFDSRSLAWWDSVSLVGGEVVRDPPGEADYLFDRVAGAR